ncbi:hypothetical protein M758_6G110000 [Ceratodon purpureus]|uniref:Uncharacterized protein n=1 Tax=Ceratodon purpureus TaxID=3225 RepID=A0A8T0HIS6_CERPU|nr:hypothetical protein KC19_6G114800 [Ceratodon purpureus]KAG0613526.1 hypothetical protein M758_6G110000 [Ceratodon purpureus]
MLLPLFLLIMAYGLAVYVPLSILSQGRKGLAVLYNTVVGTHKKRYNCTACPSAWLNDPCDIWSALVCRQTWSSRS